MPFDEMFDKMDEKQKNLLITTVTILLVVLIGYKVIYQVAIKKVNYYNNKYQEEITKNKLRQDLSKLKGLQEKYEKLIMQQQNTDAIKNELLKLASNSGVKVISISSTKKPGIGNYNTCLATMEIECNYHKLGDFVARIENKEPYMKIQSLRFENAMGMRLDTTIANLAKDILNKDILNKDTTVIVNLVIESYIFRK